MVALVIVGGSCEGALTRARDCGQTGALTRFYKERMEAPSSFLFQLGWKPFFAGQVSAEEDRGCRSVRGSNVFVAASFRSLRQDAHGGRTKRQHDHDGDAIGNPVVIVAVPVQRRYRLDDLDQRAESRQQGLALLLMSPEMQRS